MMKVGDDSLAGIVPELDAAVMELTGAAECHLSDRIADDED